MRIAFLLEMFPKISETFILNQITGLIDAGHDVTIFADHPADEEKVHDEVEKYDLLSKTIYIQKPKKYVGFVQRMASVGLEHPTAAPELVRSVRQGKQGAARLANLDTFLDFEEASNFDVFHAHFGTVGNAWDFLKNDSLLPNKVTDTPFVVSFYGVDASYVLKQDPHAYDNLFSNANRITALSKNMRSDLTNAGYPGEKIDIQPLGVDISKFDYKDRKPPENGEIRILTVARFDEQKGLEYAVDAVANIADNHDIHYYIAGDGPLREKIENKIHRQGISDSVELIGLVNHTELEHQFESAHLFLLPSVTAEDGSKEGTPTVLLEAQASGLPIVSTTHAGIPDIVDDGGSGLLVPERDVPALTNALHKLLSSPERWIEMGEHGRERVVENHSIPVVIDNLEQIYQEAGAVA